MAGPSRSRARARRAIAGLTVLVLSTGAAATRMPPGEDAVSVAIFPVENLSGGSVPAEAVRGVFTEALASKGIRVLRHEALDDFLARHRVRYTAGIDVETASSLRQETGVDAVLITSIELASPADPPKVALTSRLVSIVGAPTVVWADDTGLAGDDAPGLFELGLVHDYQQLQARALRQLTTSLLAHVQGGRLPADPGAASRFQPKSHYRAVPIEPGRQYSVAVVPFFNLSKRRNAGEILALLFIRHLSGLPQFQVLDSGVVRRQLLDARIVMEAGLSLADADTLAAIVDADFVLAGRVVRYEDHEGAGPPPAVEFSTVLIDKRTRRVVWSSGSYNDGSDGVRFFGRGATRTAHAMATQMVKLTAGMIAGGGH